MKVTNKCNKIIGFGDVTILPGDTKEIPVAYEKNPVIDFYKKNNFISVTGKPTEPDKSPEQIAFEAALKNIQEEEEKENARKEAEAIVNAMKATELTPDDENELSRIAELYGINPADCKDSADVLKKVKTVLKK